MVRESNARRCSGRDGTKQSARGASIYPSWSRSLPAVDRIERASVFARQPDQEASMTARMASQQQSVGFRRIVCGTRRSTVRRADRAIERCRIEAAWFVVVWCRAPLIPRSRQPGGRAWGLPHVLHRARTGSRSSVAATSAVRVGQKHRPGPSQEAIFVHAHGVSAGQPCGVRRRRGSGPTSRHRRHASVQLRPSATSNRFHVAP
jgi:hypothetical protein